MICGSPRGEKSYTLRLVRALAVGAQAAGASADVVDLNALAIRYCRACDVCHARGQCVHADDVSALVERLHKVEGIVLASPNYFQNVTAQMKTFLDRLSFLIHGQRLSGKYGAALATSGGPAYEPVIRYLDDTLVAMGVFYVGGVGVGLCEGPAVFEKAEARARSLGRELVEAIRTRRTYPDQIQRYALQAASFRALGERNRDRWPYEHVLRSGLPRR